MKASKVMAVKAMLLLLVIGVTAAVSAASKCSSRNGGEDLYCQLRTLQSGLQASTFLVVLVYRLLLCFPEFVEFHYTELHQLAHLQRGQIRLSCDDFCLLTQANTGVNQLRNCHNFRPPC